MDPTVENLSQKEKEALWLLLAGHDAKSSAQALSLSVHTVNERLREARRKLGVSSSREAARRLAQTEEPPPDLPVPRVLGVENEAASPPSQGRPARPWAAGRISLLIGGIMIILSLLLATSTLFGGHDDAVTLAAADRTDRTSPASAAQDSEAKSREPALAWLTLIDRQEWKQSWEAAGSLFRSQITSQGWAGQIAGARDPLGSVTSRTFQSVTHTKNLPGTPEGHYEVLEFRTDFANRRAAIETVALTQEDNTWKVIGYFIR